MNFKIIFPLFLFVSLIGCKQLEEPKKKIIKVEPDIISEPKIIKEDMFKNLQPGSIVYDRAAIQGGNTAFTEVNKTIEKNGVKIMGESNILNKLPISASSLYAKNMFNFVDNLFDKKDKKININLEDEIIEKTLIK